CLAWAVDNNLTRKVSLVDPVLIAMLKGLVAGTANLLIALALTGPVRTADLAYGLAGSAVLGGARAGPLGYGVSLVSCVPALGDRGMGWAWCCSCWRCAISARRAPALISPPPPSLVHCLPWRPWGSP